MRMQGQQVFRWAVENIHHVALAACEKAGVQPGDIDVFVPLVHAVATTAAATSRTSALARCRLICFIPL